MMASVSRHDCSSSCKALLTNRCACAVVNAGTFFKLHSYAHQKVMRQKRLCHVMMPAEPTTCLVLIHADFTFGFFERGFNRPTPARHLRQDLRRTIGGRIAQMKLEFRLRVEAATQDRPHACAGQLIVHHRHTQESKVRLQRALATFLNAVTLPLLAWQCAGNLAQFTRARRRTLDARMSARTSQGAAAWRFDRRRAQPDAGIARHFSEIPFAYGGDT